jgi:hypothetical protein
MNELTGDHPVSRIGELEQNFMRPGIQSNENYGFSASVNKVPGCIVNGDVQVANAWGYLKSAFTKYWNHAQIFSPILNEDTSRL